MSRKFSDIWTDEDLSKYLQDGDFLSFMSDNSNSLSRLLYPNPDPFKNGPKPSGLVNQEKISTPEIVRKYWYDFYYSIVSKFGVMNSVQ